MVPAIWLTGVIALLSRKKAILVRPNRNGSMAPLVGNPPQNGSKAACESPSVSEEKEWHASFSPSEMSVPAFYMDALSYEIFDESRDLPAHRKRFVIDYIKMLKQI